MMEKKLIDTHWNGVQKVEFLLLCYTCVVISHNAELNKLVAVLDDQATKSAVKNSFHRKERVQKSPSSAQPPADEPKWTLKHTREREDTPLSPTPRVSLATTRTLSSDEDCSESD